MKSAKRSKLTEVRPLPCTAIHEAAHAVVARHFSRIVEKVSISADGITGGRVHMNPVRGFYADKPDNYFRLEEEIIICMAGAEAENFYRITQRMQTRGIDYGDSLDMEEATAHQRAMGDLFTSESKDACFRRLRDLTKVLVAYDTIWSEIEILANKLLKNQTVIFPRPKTK